MKNDEQPIGPGQISKQLEKILRSEKFRNSPLLSQFLRFVVEETMAGRVNEIKEYTIATRVLGRSFDFNPQVDAAVRIHAGRLRRLLNDYYHGEGSADDIFIDIPKGGYVADFSNRPPQHQPEAINPSVGTANAGTANHKSQPNHKVTLVVFPFQNLNGDRSYNYFVESMGEQLTSEFLKFQHISLIAYHSMTDAAKEKKDLANLHNLYDIDYVLTGSVRFSEGKVQIDIQFICAVTGTLAWTQTFVQPHQSTDLNEVQENIIDQVVNRIADIDGIITKNVVNGPLAARKDDFGIYYAAYLYFAFRTKFDQESYQQTKAALEAATTADPGNAYIWTMMAGLRLYNYIFKFEPSRDDLSKLGGYAERSLWLDPNSQYGYTVLAWNYLLTGKKNDCLEAIERCLELNPRALSIVGTMGFLLICLGRTQQGFQLFLRCQQVSLVMGWFVGVGFGLYHYNNKDYKEASVWIERTHGPDFPLKTLLRVAIANRLKSAGVNDSHTPAATSPAAPLIDQPAEILDRFILNSELKESLMEGLKLS